MYEKWLEPLSKCALFEGIDKAQMLGILQCMNLTVHEFKKK
jgi:hypothetical protein